MKDFFEMIISFLTGDITQSALTAVSICSHLKTIYKKIENNAASVEEEAIYCFDTALHLFCEHFNMEYDYKAIYDTLPEVSNVLDQIQDNDCTVKVLEIAIGIDKITLAQSEYWIDCIDKVIADKELKKLNIYLNRKQERRNLKDRKVPRMLTEAAPLPPKEEQMVLREDEEREIIELIDREQKLVLVNGLGGVGKSTICKELFLKLKNEKKRMLGWVNYNGESLRKDFIDQFYYPKTYNEREEHLLYFLQHEIDENAVIFIDNLNVRDVEEQFIKKLEKANCNIICTSRITEFEYFKVVPIDFLEEFECIRLFKGYAGIEQKDVKYDEYIKLIVRKVAKHTLTIEILGKLAVAEKLTPVEILGKLEREGIDLDGVVQIDIDEGTLVEHLCRIFPINKLNERQRYVLAHFANYPLEQIPVELKDWIGLSNKYHINYLIKYGWFVENKKSFYMHPIIKEVVKKVCNLTLNDYRELLSRLNQEINYNRKLGIGDAWIHNPYYKRLIDQTSDLYTIESAWFHFYYACLAEESNQYNNAIDIFKRALNIWIKIGKRGEADQKFINTRKANIQVQIGACYYYLDDTEKAREWYRKTDRMKGEYDDKELEAQLYSNFALTYQKDYHQLKDKKQSVDIQKRYLKKALKNFNRTIKGFQELKKKDEFMAIALNNIGVLYLDLDKGEEGYEYLLSALNLRQRLRSENEMDYEKNYYDLGVAMEKIGDNASSIVRKQVKYRRALEYYYRCHETCSIHKKNKPHRVSLENLEWRMSECERKKNKYASGFKIE